MKLLYLQNHPINNLNGLQSWVEAHDCQVQSCVLCKGENLPETMDFDVLLILGGNPEECPWLEAEMRFIQQAIQQNKYVLGICLGCQLIAKALGGQLIRHEQKEIGWWPISLRKESDTHPLLQYLPSHITAFLYHQNTFTIPEEVPDVTIWGRSKGCKKQLFTYGKRVVGIQFHPEFTEQTLRAQKKYWITETGTYIQQPEKWIPENQCLEANNFIHTIMNNIYNQLQVHSN